MGHHDQYTAEGVNNNFRINLLHRYSGTNLKTILFNGIRPATGCSTAVLKCATSLTENSIRRVLVIHLVPSEQIPTVYNVYSVENDTSKLDDNGSKKPKIKKVGPGELFSISLSADSVCGPMGVFESSETDRYINSVKEQFDHIIVDAPPLMCFPQLRGLCPNMDGVILVIASGKIKRPIAVRAKREIEDAGGKIIGTVLNRRKYYIPDWLYKML